jgi:hypothetical protein
MVGLGQFKKQGKLLQAEGEEAAGQRRGKEAAGKDRRLRPGREAK